MKTLFKNILRYIVYFLVPLIKAFLDHGLSFIHFAASSSSNGHFENTHLTELVFFSGKASGSPKVVYVIS